MDTTAQDNSFIIKINNNDNHNNDNNDLGNSGDDIPSNLKTLKKRSRSDERSSNMNRQLLRHISKWFQLIYVLRDAAEILSVKIIRCIQQCKHSLEKNGEELLKDVVKVDVSSAEEVTKVAE